ncbi:MAG: hypothetical protein II191_00755 [Clostridia bacterium]|nr:hypothetical protein [Clostridia bacterium]
MKKVVSIIIILVLLAFPPACAKKGRILCRVVQTGAAADGSSGGYAAVFYRERDEAVTALTLEARFDRNTFTKEDIAKLDSRHYFDAVCKDFSSLSFTEEEHLYEGDYFIMIARFKDLDDPKNMEHMLETTFIEAGTADDISDVEGFLAAMKRRILREVPEDQIPALGMHLD